MTQSGLLLFFVSAVADGIFVWQPLEVGCNMTIRTFCECTWDLWTVWFACLLALSRPFYSCLEWFDLDSRLLV